MITVFELASSNGARLEFSALCIVCKLHVMITAKLNNLHGKKWPHCLRGL